MIIKTKKNESKRHHYVPQFYLRGWANFEDKLILYLKNKKVEPKLVSIVDVGVKENLYTSRDGDKSTETSFFTKIDGNASIVLKKILENKEFNLKIEEREVFTHFINTLYLRSPIFINELKEFNEKGRLSGLVSAEKYLKETGIDNTSLYKKGQYDDTPKLIKLISTIGENTAMSKLYENDFKKIMNARWEIIINNSSDDFITSDVPLEVINFSSPNLMELPQSFAFILPLSPVKLLLIGSDDKLFNIYNSMSQREFVKKVNVNCIKRAINQIYAKNDDSKELIMGEILG